MINPKELRIGNLVYWIYEAGGEECIEECVIESVLNDADEYYDSISLTPEWLKMFGFEFDFRGDSCLIDFDCGVILHYDKKDNQIMLCGKDAGEVLNIKYVHQLQNLIFALTGKELELKK